MNPAERMVEAARGWLAELSEEQRDRAVSPWPSDDERHRWFYTPTDHGGLPLARMRPAQVRAGLRPEHHRALSLTIAPKGVAAETMTSSQRELLRAVLAVFIGRIPEELAEREAEKFASTKLDSVHFAWAGGVERGQPHYYRLQGPRLLAEYDNTQRDVNHIHTVWRDPSADFGDDVLARHRAEFHTPPRLG